MRDAINPDQLQGLRLEVGRGKDRILVSWDTRRARSLGVLILTLAGGAQLRDCFRLSTIDVMIIGASDRLHDNPQHPFWRLCETIEWVDDVICAEDVTEASREVAARSKTHVTWPSLEYWCSDKEVDTTFHLQEAFASFGRLVPLRLRPDATVTKRANEQLRQTELPVAAVHLKNVPNAQSNAHYPAWQSLFVRTTGLASFILIGDDPIPPAISELPNVTVAEEIDDDLVFHLALIQEADFFMGLMSGPSNFALVNEKPYRIFKNPDHHEEEMNRELGAGDRYAFARPNQHIIRRRETPDLLRREFEAMLEWAWN